MIRWAAAVLVTLALTACATDRQIVADAARVLRVRCLVEFDDARGRPDAAVLFLDARNHRWCVYHPSHGTWCWPAEPRPVVPPPGEAARICGGRPGTARFVPVDSYPESRWVSLPKDCYIDALSKQRPGQRLDGSSGHAVLVDASGRTVYSPPPKFGPGYQP